MAIAESGVGNIRLVLAALPDFGMSEPFDFWFSRIVLQHNSPPLITMILQRALQMLLPGGLAVFQVPTYAVGYHFRIRDYLNSPPPSDSFEMHCLPQQAILEIAREQGCSVLEIREDNSAGSSNWISNWLALRKNQDVTADTAELLRHSAGNARRPTSANSRHDRIQPSVPPTGELTNEEFVRAAYSAVLGRDRMIRANRALRNLSQTARSTGLLSSLSLLGPSSAG